MPYEPEFHHRRSIRLAGYDYSRAGLYFVTICTQNKQCLFGAVDGGVMRLNDAGAMVRDQWLAMPERFPVLSPFDFVVMPNHMHMILALGAGGTAESEATATRHPTVGDIVKAFKSLTAIAYLRGIGEMGRTKDSHGLWQRNYYEHIIRNERNLTKIRNYIVTNPAKWDKDSEYRQS